MAERKAVNKYYPPDWDPRKGSVNKRVGQHPLRDRAKKLSQGILVIRFELPYNIWCGGCGSHVGMGVRYNAEKSKVGNYYTTPIYKFRMKCHLCDNYFEIQTDPKNHDYVILSGARRKEQRWDPVANEQIVPEDKATHKKMAMDAMFKLEHGSDDQTKGKEKVKNLAELESSRYSMKEDYLLNRMARDKFRTEKKQLKEAADADKSILQRGALDIDLVAETEEDRNLAGLLKYSVTSSYEEKQKEKRKSIEKRPLFEPLKSSSTSIDTSSSSSSSTKSSGHQNNIDDTKQTLSESLRLAQKDPFSIGKPFKLFDSSATKPSIFGIRLKGSKVMKRISKKSTLLKKSVISHTKSNCRSNSLEMSNPFHSVSSLCGDTVSDKQDVSSTSSVSIRANILSRAELSHTSPKQAPSDETAVSSTDCDISMDSSVVKHDHGRKVFSNSKEKTREESDIEEQDTSSHSHQDTANVTSSLSTSGLSMLMSSYDENKDSDSNSSDGSN